MMQISAKTTGSARVIGNRLQKAVRKQIPFAASQALNDTGKVLLTVNKREMKRVFDNPVPYTLNAFYLKRAMKADLSVAVRRKDKPAGKHYLEIQHTGGVRPRKRFETVVKYHVKYQHDLQSVLPTTISKNPRGNASMPRLMEAIAGLSERGQASSPTAPYTKNSYQKKIDARHKKLTQGKRTSDYFVGYKEDGKNKTDGIYRRSPSGKSVRKIFHLLPFQQSYKSRYPFHPRLRKRAMSYFPAEFKRRLAAAYRTMRV